MALTATQIATVAKAAGFTGRDVTIAVAVALAESDGNPNAVNHNTDSHRSNDFGLWQINDYWNPEILKTGSWSNPADNARMAYAVWKSQGWNAWATYKHGTYLAHMGKASSAVISSPNTPAPVPADATVTGAGAGFGNSLLRAGAALLGFILLMIGLSAMSGKIDTAKSAATLIASRGMA